MINRRHLTCLLLLALAAAARAQPAPRIESVSTAWFQRGSTNEVIIAGEFLERTDALLFSGAGLAGARVVATNPAVTLEASAGGLSALPAGGGRSLPIEVVVDAAAPVGAQELRVAGPQGVSNPLTVNVSDLPELAEREPNNSAAEAQSFSLPAGLSGVLEVSAEADWFRVHARAGELLIFDVQANRTGSPLDPTLMLLDSDGREIARSEDAHGLDPLLEFTPPADGDYLLKLHDQRFQGGGDYRYRLVAGARPYLDYLFPFGGQRGTSLELELAGRNLDGTDRMTLQIAANAPAGRQDVRAQTPRGASNPRPFEVGDLPERAETEPNDSSDQANALAAPVVVNGRIGATNDVDHFRLQIATDQKLVAEVHARPFGSPLDALLTLTDAEGHVLQRNDDAGGPDARLEFDAKKDTPYLLSIRDLTDRGGPRFGYRLTLRPPDTAPDFSVKLNAGRHRVSRGGHTAIRCEVERRNGFDGIVRVTAGPLPAGVEAGTLVLGPAGPAAGWLVLQAGSGAVPGHSRLHITGSGEIAGRAATRPAAPPEQGWLTVLPDAAFTVDVSQPSVALEQNASTTLDVGVGRAVGFDGEVRVTAEDLPGLTVPALVIPAGQARGQLTLNAAHNAETGIRPLMVRAEAVVSGVTNVQHAAAPVPVALSGIPFFVTAMLPGSSFFLTNPVKLSATALPPGSDSVANQTEFVVKVERRGLTNEIALALEGLPEGVTATVTNLVADSKEAAFRLLVTDQAAPKEYEFTVAASVTHNDRIWRQKTAPITLVIAASEKELAATNAEAAAPAKP